MTIELMKHQRVGGQWFLEQQDYPYYNLGSTDGDFTLKGGISWLLGDAPRVGKTLTAIHTDAQLREYDDVWDETAPTLIVCPPQVMSVWADALESYYPIVNVAVVDRPKRQFWKYALENNYTFYICNYDTLPLEIDLMKKIKWFHVIVDECHNVKGRHTPKKPVKRSKALRDLKTRHKGATSGTPADNAPQDMWNILNWLWPKDWSSYWRFVDECFETFTNPNTGYKIIKRVNPDMLNLHYWPKLEGKYLRRTRADVSDNLPKITYQEIKVPMSAKMIKAYEEYEEQNMTSLDSVYGGEIDLLSGYDVVVHSRLQQLAIGECEIVEDEEGKWDEDLDMFVPTQKLYLKEGKSPKLDSLVEFAKDDGQPLVVFCQHPDTANKLHAQLIASKISSVRYTGGAMESAKFKNGAAQVIVGTFGKMREGIDLAREDGGTVCFIDRASRTKWNVQAEARVENIKMPGQNINVIDFNSYIPNREKPTIDQTRRARFTVKNEDIELMTNRPS